MFNKLYATILSIIIHHMYEMSNKFLDRYGVIGTCLPTPPLPRQFIYFCTACTFKQRLRKADQIAFHWGGGVHEEFQRGKLEH